jgi:hypothetical protein
MLVKATVPRHQSFHDFSPDAKAPEIGRHEQVRIVDDQASVGDGIS